MTLEQRLDLIAQHVPAFRSICTRETKRVVFPHDTVYPFGWTCCSECFMHDDHGEWCLQCHGTGYVAKPVHELAETLHSLGWEGRMAFGQVSPCWEWALYMPHSLTITPDGFAVRYPADEALVTATLMALGVTVQ